MASEIRVNKIENRSGLGTVTFADTGVDLAGIVTATTFSGSGASLTNLPAANVTGTLPAISGANLTNLPAANITGTLPAISAANLTNVPAANVVGVHTSLTVTNATTTGTVVVGGGVTISESGIEASGIGITCASINGTQIGGRRNLIINGAMQIAQRSTSAVNISGGKTWSDVDRFGQWTTTAHGNWKSGEQAADAPTDFQYSRKITSLAANTATTSMYHTIRYTVEGYDAKQLNCGFSSAKTVTLSFHVKSSLTGTFGLNFTNSANDRSYSTTYAISAANTWERKTITLTMDTTGTWPTTNAVGLEINWVLAMGSSYQTSTLNQWQANWRFPDTGTNALLTTNGATFQLTGVQLEVGSQATAFEHRSYAEELALCQRYYYRNGASDNKVVLFNDYNNNTNNFWANIALPTTMRAAPTLTATGISGGDSLDSSSTSKYMLNLQTSDGSKYIGNGTVIEANAEI